MATTRVIKAQDIVKDIRVGMSDAELMAKYRFTQTGLQSVLRQLVDIMAITRAEIYERLATSMIATTEDVRVQSMRKLPRHPALFPIPIYDADRPEVSGMLRDVNELGVGITGIECSVAERRRFVILGDEFVAVAFDTFSFTAVCRWIRTGEEEHPYIAGFEITSIEAGDAEELRKLIQSLTFCSGGPPCPEPAPGGQSDDSVAGHQQPVE